MLLCTITHVCLPYSPPYQADISASILKFHLFPSLKTKQKCIAVKLPCEPVIYNSLSFVNFCQIPLLLRGVVQFHKFVASLSSMAFIVRRDTGSRELSRCKQVLCCDGLRSSENLIRLRCHKHRLTWE